MTMSFALRVLRPLAVSCILVPLLLGTLRAQDERSLLNHPAPGFSLVDLHGARIDLAKDRGKVVLLNFWATWCAPCRVEMPQFVQWQQHYAAQGFQIIGVSIDDSSAPVGPFVQKMRLNYPVLMGTENLSGLYGGVYGVPVTFLIDRRGILRARFDGGSDTAQIHAELLRLLAAH